MCDIRGRWYSDNRQYKTYCRLSATTGKPVVARTAGRVERKYSHIDMSKLVFIFISYNTKCASLIQVLLILAIKDIFKILSILVLLQHLVYLEDFFSAYPAA